jgi:hypothetical protein
MRPTPSADAARYRAWLWKQIKHLSVEQGKPTKQILAEALQWYVRKSGKVGVKP